MSTSESNPEVELWFERSDSLRGKGEPRMLVHTLSRPNNRAGFALTMLERWGLVVGEDDGEDTAGRAKVGRMSVADSVRLACDIADETFNEIERRGWLIPIPAKAEIEARLNAEDDEKSNQ